MKSKIIISILIILVVTGILVYKSNLNLETIIQDNDSATALSTTTLETNIPSITTENNAQVVISSIDDTPTTPSIPVPNLDKPLVFPETFTDAQRKDFGTRIDQYVALLKKDKLDFNAWIDLGLYRKNIKDYQGAFEAWNYASAIYPKDSLPVLNIASLYGYDSRDIVKAEMYYQKAISLEQVLDYPYFAAAMFYEEVMQDIPKAISVVEKGIRVIPSSLELRAYKSGLEETLAKATKS